MSHKINNHIFTSLFFFILITGIIYYPIPIDNIEKYLPYMLEVGPHADWNVIIDANKCQSIGFDVYINNPCDPLSRSHVYGKILLYIPYFEKLDFLYYVIFPNFINYFFILILLKIFNPVKFISYVFLLSLLILQPFILALERSNIDIIIFISIFFMSKYNNLLINYILLLIITLSKFFPITLVSIFLFLKRTRDTILCISFFLLLLFFLFFLQIDNITNIAANKSQFTGGLSPFTFSFYLMPKIFFFISNNYDFGLEISSLYFYIFYFSIFSFIFVWNFTYVKKKEIFKKFNYGDFHERLFLMGLIISVTCYFILDNYIYREIFLILLIPFMIYFPYKSHLSYINKLKNLLYLKFIIPSFLTLLTVLFYPKNDILIGINMLIKSSLDNLLLVVLFSNLICIIFLALKKKFT